MIAYNISKTNDATMVCEKRARFVWEDTPNRRIFSRDTVVECGFAIQSLFVVNGRMRFHISLNQRVPPIGIASVKAVGATVEMTSCRR